MFSFESKHILLDVAPAAAINIPSSELRSHYTSVRIFWCIRGVKVGEAKAIYDQMESKIAALVLKPSGG